jgi:murein DD-endopeptidase MepM/ murein hydrolase activator NlpD
LGQRRTLSGWLTNRYLLIIRNEENFAEKRTITFNYARLILLLALGFIISMFIAMFLITTILDEWLDPRHAEMVANRQILELTMSIDSLEYENKRKNSYIENIKLILDGQNVDSVRAISASEPRGISGEIDLSPTLSAIDSQFRAEYESTDLGLVSLISDDSDELRRMFLFNPVEGIITQQFDSKSEHYGIDIVSKENEPIKSVADGMVIMSSWTLDDGYVLSIQHRGNLISIYKHNSELLKNVGSFVAAGEIVSIIGNTGELTSGPHLHMELWHKGQAVNPEDYIIF